ncbi:hypothetical protein D0817_25610, partial [Flavobacterium cupreum]
VVVDADGALGAGRQEARGGDQAVGAALAERLGLEGVGRLVGPVQIAREGVQIAVIAVAVVGPVLGAEVAFAVAQVHRIARTHVERGVDVEFVGDEVAEAAADGRALLAAV